MSRHPKAPRLRLAVTVAAATLLAALGLATTISATSRDGTASRKPAGTSGTPQAPQHWDALVTTQVTGSSPGPWIPQGFVSLSIEASDFDRFGSTLSAPQLLSLIRGLHPGFLRVGAGTGDRAPLSRATLSRIANLGHAAEVPIVLELPFRADKPGVAIAQAVLAARIIGSSLHAVEIGNETDAYARFHFRRMPWTYSAFALERAPVLAGLRTAGVRAAVWGPDNSGPAWLRSAAAEHPSPYQVLTPHFYPLNRCGGPQPSIAALLGDGVHREEVQEGARLRQAGMTSGLPVVVGETNSVACGGQPGVSNTAASALWATDYGLVEAQAGAASLAFHIPESGCDGYSPICLQGSGSTAHWVATPEYRGLQILVSLEGDRFTTSTVHSLHHHLRAYTLVTPSGSPRLVAIDLDPPGRRPALVQWADPGQVFDRLNATTIGATDYASTSVAVSQTVLDTVPALTSGEAGELRLDKGTVTVAGPARP